jgi:hypothetical protein
MNVVGTMAGQAARRRRAFRITLAAAAAACAFLPTRGFAQVQDPQFEAAARAAARLAPADVPGLPDSVEVALREHGCTVPQYRSEEDAAANNVIRGEFAQAGQLDYAALCSRAGRTSLLVIWGGSARCADETQTGADVDAMVGADDEVVYARQIQLLPKARAEEFAWLETPSLGRIEHDGILHSVGEYQTSFLYCRGGRWIEIEPDPTT